MRSISVQQNCTGGADDDKKDMPYRDAGGGQKFKKLLPYFADEKKDSRQHTVYCDPRSDIRSVPNPFPRKKFVRYGGVRVEQCSSEVHFAAYHEEKDQSRKNVKFAVLFLKEPEKATGKKDEHLQIFEDAILIAVLFRKHCCCGP